MCQINDGLRYYIHHHEITRTADIDACFARVSDDRCVATCYPPLRNCGFRRHRTFSFRVQITQEMNVSKDEGMLIIVLIVSLWNQNVDRRIDGSTYRITMFVLLLAIRFSLNGDLQKMRTCQRIIWRHSYEIKEWIDASVHRCIGTYVIVSSVHRRVDMSTC